MVSLYSKQFDSYNNLMNRGFPTDFSVQVEAPFNVAKGGKLSGKVSKSADKVSSEVVLRETRECFGTKVDLESKTQQKAFDFSAGIKKFGKVDGLNVKATYSRGIPYNGSKWNVSEEFVQDNFSITGKYSFKGLDFEKAEVTGSYKYDTYTFGVSKQVQNFKFQDLAQGLAFRVTQDHSSGGKVFYEAKDHPIAPKSWKVGFLKPINNNLTVAAGYDMNEVEGGVIEVGFQHKLDRESQLKVKYDSKNNLKTAFKLKPYASTEVTVGATISGSEEATFGLNVKVNDSL